MTDLISHPRAESRNLAGSSRLFPSLSALIHSRTIQPIARKSGITRPVPRRLRELILLSIAAGTREHHEHRHRNLRRPTLPRKRPRHRQLQSHIALAGTARLVSGLIIAVIAGYGQIRNNGPLIVEDVRSILAVVRGLTERPMELLNIATRLYADVHC